MFKKHTPKKEVSAIKTLTHGNPKVGKTTTLSKVPGLWFIATERGYSFLECEVADVFSWEDAEQVLAYLTKEKPASCKGVVIDTINNLIDMAEKHYCQKHKITHLSDHAFGKGYNGVKDMVMQYLQSLEAAGLSIHMISHSKEKEIKGKVKSETVVMPNLSQGMTDALTGFVDQIFFAYIDADGQRKMRTKPTRNIVAGDRSALLPEIMPLDFEAVEKTLKGDK